jgi:hypothetical protein
MSKGYEAMSMILRPFMIVAAGLALTVAAHAAEVPASGAPAQQTLPSADVVPDPTAPPIPPNDPAVQASLPGCAAWTDSCVTCQREAGRVFCSNIGIACQPKAVTCTRPEPAEEKKDVK